MDDLEYDEWYADYLSAQGKHFACWKLLMDIEDMRNERLVMRESTVCMAFLCAAMLFIAACFVVYNPTV